MDPPDHTHDPAGASDRLRLEVELLAAAEPAPAPAELAAGAAPRAVLVALAEPDLAAYVRDCLQVSRRLAVVEPDPGEHALAAARRLRPALLVAEPATLGTAPAAPPVPLLLLVEEWPRFAAARPPPATPVAVLVQPFNARRLLAAVEPLLGPPDPA